MVHEPCKRKVLRFIPLKIIDLPNLVLDEDLQSMWDNLQPNQAIWDENEISSQYYQGSLCFDIAKHVYAWLDVAFYNKVLVSA